MVSGTGKREPDVVGGALKIALVDEPAMSGIGIGRRRPDIVGGAVKCFVEGGIPSSGITYSTSEVKTNDVWIDGKPIYRKVIDFGALPNTATKSVNHGISGMGTLVRSNAVAHYTAGGSRIPVPNTFFAGQVMGIEVTNTAVRIWADFAGSYLNACKVILEYTKT